MIRRLQKAWVRAALWLLCGLCWTLPLLAHPDTPPLTISASADKIPYHPHLQYWQDPSGHSTFAQARAATFQPLTRYNLGFSPHAHWLKLQLQPDQAAQHMAWVMAFYWPVIDWLDVWVEQPQGWQHYAMGDHRPYAQRIVKSRFPAVPIQFTSPKPLTIYLRLQSSSAVLVLGDLWPAAAFDAADKTDDIAYGFYFGLSAMVVIIFVILGLWLQDLAFLGYSGFVGAFILITLGLNGYVSLLFAHGPMRASDWAVGLSVLMMTLFNAVMMKSLLNTREQHPLMHRIYHLVIALSLLAMPLVASRYYGLIAQTAIFWMLVASVVPIYYLAQTYRRTRSAEYGFYLLGFFQLSLNGLIYALMMLDLLALEYESGLRYQNAVFVSILFMSMGMACRVRQIEIDKVRAVNLAEQAQLRAQDERRFVAMLSHEFRNPLASIDRSAQLLQLTLQSIDTAIATRLNNVRASVSRLSLLVDNFLLSERIQAGQMPLTLNSHATAELVDDIRAHMTEADWARIDLQLQAFTYTFDLGMLSMAVGNLLHNALRYAYPDTRISLSIQQQAHWLEIRVSDAGPGISPEEIAKLGMPYYRTKHTVGKKGTGLGYYFCKTIVDLHGGRLAAYNNHLGGLEVVIKLTQPANTSPS